MRHRGRRHAGDEEVEQAPERAARGTHSPNGVSTRSAEEDHVLGLQQIAGNQAVVQSLAANSLVRPATGTPGVGRVGDVSAIAETVAVAQRNAAEAAPHRTLGPEFEAAWRTEVIVPLGRVTFLLEEEGVPVGAMRRLNQALKAILEVLAATPRDDPNWHRVQLLGRMVNALSDLVAIRGGSKPTHQELVADMIIWRRRAVELEPLIRHAPGGGSESPVQAWHELVVLPMGRAQVRLEHAPEEAVQGYLHAVEGIMLTRQATPGDDPARIRISSLLVAVQGMLDRLQAVTGLGSPDLVGRAIETFQAAEALGARLAGKPAPGPSGAAEKRGNAAEAESTAEEPPFTWEREGGPIMDSDQLERP
jgi:hypothetical protein